MSLFPQSFVEDVKAQTDIVALITDVTPLKKAGASWKGLCPFHTERTPSFTVNGDKGFFKCFGCDAKGDVFKFVELHQKLSFPEAVRYLAQRAGMTVPESEGSTDDRAEAREREALIALHEDALAFFREQLQTPAGGRARRELESRVLAPETIATFRYGYAPAAGRDTLNGRFASKGIGKDLQIRSGLVMERDDGRLVDRFRNRLMIPIARDTGAVVAFGGRALDEGQVPKYLNSPETPIYTKSRMLYGLDVTRTAVREQDYCVLVEGYFDFAQVWQAGIKNVAAICGTALTAQQVRQLKRFTSKVILNLDPDTAGQAAAARSSQVLVPEGFDLKVALLPAGGDPDSFIRKSGKDAFRERLRGSQPYLEFLLDQAAKGLNLNRPEDQRKLISSMWPTVLAIPDAVTLDQFIDRLTHKARLSESLRNELREAVKKKKSTPPSVRTVAMADNVGLAEKGLLWTLVHHPVEGLAAVAQLEPDDMDGLVAEPIFRMARSLAEMPPEMLPALLRERLSEGERQHLESAAAEGQPAGTVAGCLTTLRHERIGRDLAAVRDEIVRAEEQLSPSDPLLSKLMARRVELKRLLDS